MCTVTLNIDEAQIREINPSLTDMDAITRWLQQQMDNMIACLWHDGEKKKACTETEAKAMTLRRGRDIKAGRAKLIPHTEVMQEMEKMIATYGD